MDGVWFTNGHQMPEIALDGHDAIAVVKGVQEAVRAARHGAGPRLILAKLVPSNGRTEDEAPICQFPYAASDRGQWKDPIERLRRELCMKEAAADQELGAIEEAIAAEVSDLYQWAYRAYVM
jgi:TPP-dependent pyruvate/acetoin dehydrogenase alpha subunit